MKLHSWPLAGLALLLSWPVEAFPQNDAGRASPIPNSLAAKYQIDFAVPDGPAFTILGITPSTILRPTTVRELSAAVSDFIGGGSTLSIPRAFAIELAPALLIGGGKLSLPRYQAAPALYRLRVSAATRRSEGSDTPTEIGLGLRVNLVDQADLRTNPAYIERVTRVTDQINQLFAARRMAMGPPSDSAVSHLLTPDSLPPELQKQVADLQGELEKAWADSTWNARVLEVAAGMSARAADSLGHDLSTQAFAAWATFGTGFGTWGQLLLGGQLSSTRDSVTREFHALGSLGARFVVGTNAYKGFVEGQQMWQPGYNPWLLNAGGEARLIKGAWVAFGAGLKSQPGGKTDLVTNFTFKLGTSGP